MEHEKTYIFNYETWPSLYYRNIVKTQQNKNKASEANKKKRKMQLFHRVNAAGFHWADAN